MTTTLLLVTFEIIIIVVISEWILTPMKTNVLLNPIQNHKTTVGLLNFGITRKEHYQP